MISLLLFFILAHAEETKSFPTIEVYTQEGPDSCARECMNISKSLNPKNNTPEVLEVFKHNCQNKIERTKTEPNKFLSELQRCDHTFTAAGKEKLKSISDYIFGGAAAEKAKSIVTSTPGAVRTAAGNVVYSIKNADTVLANAYNAAGSAVRSTTQATLEALNGFRESLSSTKFKEVKDKCEADTNCKLAVARGFLQFQERKANGEHIVSDEQVLQQIKSMRFDAILSKSTIETHRAKMECQKIQGEILRTIFVQNKYQWPTDTEQRLNKEIVAKNPACPFVLTQTPAVEKALNGEPKKTYSITHMWSMVDSCFGAEALHEVNDVFCKQLGKEASELAIGGAMAKAIQLGLKGVQARKLLDAFKKKKSIPPNHEVLSVVDNQVITRAHENGKPVYYKIADGKPPEKLSMDPSGFAINARDGANRQLALADIGAAQASGEAKAVLFIDVNNLGKVNYFKAGSQAGDQYLGEVARIIAEKTGGKGKVYRWGGDEFVVVLNETDKAKIKELNQTISDAVMKSPLLKSIFSAEKAAAAERYKLLNPPKNRPSTITSYDELPQSFKETLSPAEQTFARRDFEAFRAKVKEIDGLAIRESAAIQPSISMGGAITDGRTASEILAAADSQAAKVKKVYKSALGCDDTKKYTGRDSYLPTDDSFCLPRNLSARPEALLPD